MLASCLINFTNNILLHLICGSRGNKTTTNEEKKEKKTVRISVVSLVFYCPNDIFAWNSKKRPRWRWQNQELSQLMNQVRFFSSAQKLWEKSRKKDTERERGTENDDNKLLIVHMR